MSDKSTSGGRGSVASSAAGAGWRLPDDCGRATSSINLNVPPSAHGHEFCLGQLVPIDGWRPIGLIRQEEFFDFT